MFAVAISMAAAGSADAARVTSEVVCEWRSCVDQLRLVAEDGEVNDLTVRPDSGGYAVAMRWSMKAIYDVAPGETMFTASDVGWVVGHSYIVYAPLLTGATTVLYEGKPVGTPDAG